MGNTAWRPELINAEKLPDELWIGVKGQSSWVIAGTLRNIFRYSFEKFYHGGRALNGLGVFTRLPNPTKLRMPLITISEDSHRVIRSRDERERAQNAG